MLESALHKADSLVLRQLRVECRRTSAGGAVMAPGDRRAAALVIDAEGEARLPARSCQPTAARVEVSFRQPPTFAASARPAAASL